ncbi:MAG: dienelactone hydrolase family protein [Isosphaeraceae bacterium]
MTRTTCFRMVCLLIASLSVGSSTRGADATLLDVVESTGGYLSQGKMIRVERFEPRMEGKHPAVLILHGSAGMAVGGPVFRETGRKLAARGFVAHLVHYFDASGTRRADRPTMLDKFPNWIQTVADGLSYVTKQPNVDPQRLGLMGFSLGGYLSLSLAMYDPRVTAVVDYFGGLPSVIAKDLKGFPPTLIIHGAADPVVPVAEARSLESLLKSKNVTYEMKIYPGQGHGLVGHDADDAAERTVSFLHKHLMNGNGTVRHEVARPRFDRVEALRAGAAGP